ncbi:Holliday junction resolvase RuvX [Candidatus Uhrbacteria bacterium]|nr:Holliday junction resolvase RuvX [Candidatus Uhrbacteria bacterium]MBD3284195.1 Holliday junction resolvase RuvX [Candidatus Uhrbacteria bacterium]
MVSGTLPTPHTRLTTPHTPNMRVLGIDYGSKRVGLALGDTVSKLASPWGVLPNEGFDTLTDRIGEVADRDDVERVIVGIPKPLKDPQLQNAQVLEVQEFVEVLKGTGLNVEVMDESFSSKLASTLVAETGGKEKRDDVAAQVILQTWLDQQ